MYSTVPYISYICIWATGQIPFWIQVNLQVEDCSQGIKIWTFLKNADFCYCFVYRVSLENAFWNFGWELLMTEIEMFSGNLFQGVVVNI